MILDADSQRAMGLRQDHLQTDEALGLLLDPEAGTAFKRLVKRAEAEGLSLAVASGYRDYGRQLYIFNAKAAGRREVHDDEGAILTRPASPDSAWLHAILRFSALPGTSRHHWGTDFDVWDPRSAGADYQLQLTPSEYALGGVFSALTEWLSDLLARDDAEGFYRPYAIDGGAVAPEPWHLSYRPRASRWQSKLRLEVLQALWRAEDRIKPLGITEPLALVDLVLAQGEVLFERYIAVDAP